MMRIQTDKPTFHDPAPGDAANAARGTVAARGRSPTVTFAHAARATSPSSGSSRSRSRTPAPPRAQPLSRCFDASPALQNGDFLLPMTADRRHYLVPAIEADDAGFDEDVADDRCSTDLTVDDLPHDVLDAMTAALQNHPAAVAPDIRAHYQATADRANQTFRPSLALSRSVVGLQMALSAPTPKTGWFGWSTPKAASKSAQLAGLHRVLDLAERADLSTQAARFLQTEAGRDPQNLPPEQRGYPVRAVTRLIYSRVIEGLYVTTQHADLAPHLRLPRGETTMLTRDILKKAMIVAAVRQIEARSRPDGED